MTDTPSPLVECPVCETEFDPTAAGGWCTNSECGEWQYIGDEVPDPEDATGGDDEASAEADAGEAATEGSDDVGVAAAGDAPATESEDAEGSEPTPAIRSTAGDADDADGQNPGDADDADGPDRDNADDADGPDPGDDEVATAAAGGAPDADEPAPDADADEPTPDATAPAVEPTCPDCGESVAPDDSFCVACGADLDDVAEPALEACLDCGADVDEADSFCASCGADLDEARGSTGDAETSGATAGGDGTADAGDGAADAGDAATGGGQALTTPEADGESSLVLRARGEELTVADGETVGREVRRLVTETGGDQDDAVLIHREHVRFVREDGQFYLVDLGDNPTAVNGARLSKGDREPVGPGDEIELSGVVTVAVEAP